MFAQREIFRKQSRDSLKLNLNNLDATGGGSSSAVLSPLNTPQARNLTPGSVDQSDYLNSKGLSDSEQEKVDFEGIEKPRVRYDVEVVTKLIIYAGIGLLAVEVDPILFSYIGLAP